MFLMTLLIVACLFAIVGLAKDNKGLQDYLRGKAGVDELANLSRATSEYAAALGLRVKALEIVAENRADRERDEYLTNEGCLDVEVAKMLMRKDSEERSWGWHPLRVHRPGSIDWCRGPLMTKIVGTCSECGGPVERDVSGSGAASMTTKPGKCRNCDAVEKVDFGPVIQMVPRPQNTGKINAAKNAMRSLVPPALGAAAGWCQVNQLELQALRAAVEAL